MSTLVESRKNKTLAISYPFPYTSLQYKPCMRGRGGGYNANVLNLRDIAVLFMLKCFKKNY